LFFAFSVFIFTLTFFLQNDLPDNFLSTGENPKIDYYLKITSSKDSPKSSYSKSSYMVAKNKNSDTNHTVTLKLMGAFPIKKVTVKKTNRYYVVPSGEPFGIKLYTKGVMVISLSEINSGGKSYHPADDAGIKIGDIILEIDDSPVSSNEDISQKINDSKGRDLSVLIQRGNRTLIKNLTPVYSKSEGRYMAGIWVRDSSAGIGTLTYYTEDKTFGGLGHPVCDIDTGEIIPISSGEIVSAKISGVTKSTSGVAGELKGFFTVGNISGKILINCDCGVFGILDNLPDDEKREIPVAFRQEVKPGKAKILSTIDDKYPEYYDCIIERINYGSSDDDKNMTIKITDEKLLSKTGGIVQGMSGSPIIQDGKLIGAVTHVFVNNPKYGYAIFSEKMYEESEKAEKIYKNQNQNKNQNKTEDAA
jgi:stage IV sporulation protein B